jgi:hypothetical protein
MVHCLACLAALQPLPASSSTHLRKQTQLKPTTRSGTPKRQPYTTVRSQASPHIGRAASAAEVPLSGVELERHGKAAL